MAHVLPGSILASCRRHQPALAVHDVRHQSAQTDLLQPPDQVVHVYHRTDHPQKASVVHDRRADQHDSSRRFPAAHHQRLPAVDAAFAGGLIGSLQFPLQKSVGLHTPGGNSPGIGVQQRGIGNVFRRRNKILHHRPQFWRQKFLRAKVAPAGIGQHHHLNRRRQIGQHHAQRFLVLGNVVGQRTRDRVLQQHFVGFQALPIHGLDLRRVEVHREDTDGQEHAQDDVKQFNARGNVKLQWQKAILSAQARGWAGPCPCCIHSKLLSRADLRCLKYNAPLRKYHAAGDRGKFSVASSQFSASNSRRFSLKAESLL